MPYSPPVLTISQPRARWTLSLGLSGLVSLAFDCPRAHAAPGYHKDLFIDCGPHLLCPSPHAAKHLGLRYEIMRTKSSSEQQKHIVGHPQDDNGVLLYPDGAPRYRSVYVNGGESKDHGKTLGAKGLARFRDFYLHGGSYTGSCAGAFIASRRRMGKDMQDLYFSIWPGETRETWYGTQASSWYIGPSAFKLEKGSPLLKYSDFGNDLYVDQIKHYEGPYALEGEHWPKKTEVLARFDLPKARFHNTPAVWAYQKDKNSGRMVVVASHPENYSSGERMDLMAAILSYALDGNAKPKLKGRLHPGKTLSMSKGSEDKDPCRSKIGDGQLHHFALTVPKGTSAMAISLEGDELLSSGERAKLHLFARPKEAAWPADATHKSEEEGAAQTLDISDPASGIWFVSVLGASRVSEASQSSATSYAKNLGALNGIAYKLSVSLDQARIQESERHDPDPWCDRFIEEVDTLPDPEDSPEQSPNQSPEPSPSQSEQSEDTPQSPKDSASSKKSVSPESSSSSSSNAATPDDAQDDEDSSQGGPPSGCQVHRAPLGQSLLVWLLFYVKSRRRKSSLAMSKQTTPYPNA